MCRQIGPFVEVGEEISNYGIKIVVFRRSFQYSFVMLLTII
jgi:hypothetical protein